ncbi:hypothetical protein GGX14DRAFT_560865 [Mycena pura]|uniref:Uncharacterized protein n=1 Tax=Mycena pura TaxID=153505 RepID=A0AAD6VPU0_9AGAR|nr:hypothetical protein GGX14DRAFT_560865 [Mycena pura]
MPPTVTPTNSSAPTVTPSSTALTVPPTPVNVVSTGPPTPTSSAFSTPTVTSTTKLSSATSGPLVAGVVVGGFAVVGTIVARHRHG